MGDQGVQQMQQPVVVYPTAYTKQYPYQSSSSSSSSGSRGSFGTVFIVLAVILVLSVLACVFGRLCNRESRAAKQDHSKQPKHEKGSSKKSREIRPVDREPRERGDLEFGLDMKRPEHVEKPSGRDYGEDIELGFDNKREERGRGGPPPPPVIKHGVRFKLPENGNHHAKGEVRRGGPDFELRPRH
ncbi:hypothetical protein BRARA_H02208 [Brassica rapa]|uniref:Transmembrane protein n=2 Tax=Brassica TaxID=3705 RepID=A0A397YDM1_BRACM|nr:uncharacterized protein LOC106415310 [Brassica napus]RID51555.1 hypothetical protein BRARA_H02208 [Brassica rapa]CAF2255401.1 unnamed protein product [Brassica napus]CAG7899407.1 unnamed protein product [Brassica rapa]CDY41443.1 BnaA08g20450D [Brassica napus]VDD06827.1 unnamed protein product [Brassica rapa]